MLRFLSSRYTSAGALRSKLTFPDPEHLARLQGQFSPSDASAADVASQFSTYVSSIRIVGHISKFTAPNRLREANRLLFRHLRALGADEIFLLDVGGSDGVTTLDLVRAMRDEQFGKVRAHLIDRYIRLLRFSRRTVVEYRMPDGTPILIRLGPLGLQLSSVEHTRDPLSRLLGRFYLRRQNFREAMTNCGSISLVNPAVTADPDIAVVEGNALVRLPEFVDRANVVRASNLLNRAYFTDEQIDQITGHLHAYLTEGGLLLVSRNHTDKGSDHDAGTIWAKRGDHFERLEDFGGGSEAAEIIDAFRASAAT